MTARYKSKLKQYNKHKGNIIVAESAVHVQLETKIDFSEEFDNTIEENHAVVKLACQEEVQMLNCDNGMI